MVSASCVAVDRNKTSALNLKKLSAKTVVKLRVGLGDEVLFFMAFSGLLHG